MPKTPTAALKAATMTDAVAISMPETAQSALLARLHLPKSQSMSIGHRIDHSVITFLRIVIPLYLII
jgi:hypothetical protein